MSHGAGDQEEGIKKMGVDGGQEQERPTASLSHSYTQNAWEGNKYDQNRSLKEIAIKLREELKQRFPACTFSVVKKSYSMGQSLTVALMQAPACVWDSENVAAESKGYAQLNHYQLTRPGWDEERLCNGVKLSPETWVMLKTVVQMCDAYNFDDSDAQIDYFHNNFHFHLAIGKWNKPFQVKNP